MAPIRKEKSSGQLPLTAFFQAGGPSSQASSSKARRTKKRTKSEALGNSPTASTSKKKSKLKEDSNTPSRDSRRKSFIVNASFTFVVNILCM